MSMKPTEPTDRPAAPPWHQALWQGRHQACQGHSPCHQPLGHGPARRATARSQHCRHQGGPGHRDGPRVEPGFSAGHQPFRDPHIDGKPAFFTTKKECWIMMIYRKLFFPYASIFSTPLQVNDSHKGEIWSFFLGASGATLNMRPF